jgi:hypothetical protein
LCCCRRFERGDGGMPSSPSSEASMLHRKLTARRGGGGARAELFNIIKKSIINIKYNKQSKMRLQ